MHKPPPDDSKRGHAPSPNPSSARQACPQTECTPRVPGTELIGVQSTHHDHPAKASPPHTTAGPGQVPTPPHARASPQHAREPQQGSATQPPTSAAPPRSPRARARQQGPTHTTYAAALTPLGAPLPRAANRGGQIQLTGGRRRGALPRATTRPRQRQGRRRCGARRDAPHLPHSTIRRPRRPRPLGRCCEDPHHGQGVGRAARCRRLLSGGGGD